MQNASEPEVMSAAPRWGRFAHPQATGHLFSLASLGAEFALRRWEEGKIKDKDQDSEAARLLQRVLRNARSLSRSRSWCPVLFQSSRHGEVCASRGGALGVCLPAALPGLSASLPASVVYKSGLKMGELVLPHLRPLLLSSLYQRPYMGKQCSPSFEAAFIDYCLPTLVRAWTLAPALARKTCGSLAWLAWAQHPVAETQLKIVWHSYGESYTNSPTIVVETRNTTKQHWVMLKQYLARGVCRPEIWFKQCLNL